MTIYNERNELKGQYVLLFGFIALMMVVGIIWGGWAGIKAFGRYQRVQDAKNSVRVSEVEIRNQKQRVEIAKQKAEIRLQDAIGVREAQDAIAKTLTPLYVQYEMVDAMRQIAASGRNNTVVFVPAGANGIPLVHDLSGATRVGLPEQKEE